MNSADKQIRNFSIIAHIDHGKSTLADRFLELTGTVDARHMRAQYLDRMDLERERGITIKLKPIQMQYKGYTLNLIDTPGHVDFTYEVSRSLAAVEGVILIVDATQGVEAQTVANLYLALQQDLQIIPVMNKIDLPNADVPRVRQELAQLIGVDPESILAVSAKTGEGVEAVLERIIAEVPAPKGTLDAPTQALIFDSYFDDYRGVISSVRVVNGAIRSNEDIRFLATKTQTKALEVGHFGMEFQPKPEIKAGEIGYIVTGLRDIEKAKVGDTISTTKSVATALPGYQAMKPMVFAALYCQSGDEFERLREGIEKLKLNDAALDYIPEHSPALGFGFRCGFLGMLHMEVVEQRLKREFGISVIVSAPSVAYRITTTNKETKDYANPMDWPEANHIVKVEEPWMSVTVVSPNDWIGPVMQAVTDRRGVYKTTEYLEGGRLVLHYEVPLSSLISDFHDTLKSVSQGYASLNYDYLGFREADVTRLDIHVAEEMVDALTMIVNSDEAYREGRRVVDTLKDILPRQQFELKIQALIGGKVIASSRIAPLRKDVTAKLYGGDVTRKRKLLEKQKKGKKRMKTMGRVSIPADAYIKLLRR
ncbi:MAG: elongation factor 4 [Candidatus Nomurabacteria bacterium]|nr:MAG: elongation factor 4 [Candidatus Nomurabacteria bacterium]